MQPDYDKLLARVAQHLAGGQVDSVAPARPDDARPPGEKLAILGDDVLAAALEARAARAGWGVERVRLFDGEGLAGLANECTIAVARASIVIVTAPATSHNALGVLLRQCVSPDALVLLVPGQPGGALQVALGVARGAGGPVVAETSWRPMFASGGDGGEALVDVPGVPLATIPEAAAPEVAGRLAPLFEAMPVPNVFWTAIHAPDLILRTIPALITGGVEAHARGVPLTLGEVLRSPAAQGLVKAMERERAEVARAYDVDLPPLSEWLGRVLGTPAGRLDFALGPLADTRVPALGDPSWLVDLAPNGLVPFCALAERFGVPTPCAQAMLRVAGPMLGNDYGLAGRSAEAMGLSPSAAQTATGGG